MDAKVANIVTAAVLVLLSGTVGQPTYCPGPRTEDRCVCNPVINLSSGDNQEDETDTSKDRLIAKLLEQVRNMSAKLTLLEQACDWKLVFKVVADVDENSYDVWESSQTLTSYPPSLTGCGHYKGREVEMWESLNIKQVRLSLYTFSPQAEVRDLIFNGEGSDKNNWFSKDRLISSPWSDLKTEATNFFSIAGIHEIRSSQSWITRRFHINRSYGGCPADIGWLVVLDGNSNVCEWERRTTGNPRILYSKLPGYVNWEGDPANVGQADVMAIFIKTCDD